MTVVFYDWPYSPFCMKVRAILNYKSIVYQTVNPLDARGKLRRRGTGKVPALEIDGAFVTDSTDIAYALQERFPEPSLLPLATHERGLSHAIEDWADESLYFLGLYYRWKADIDSSSSVEIGCGAADSNARVAGRSGLSSLRLRRPWQCGRLFDVG